MSRVRIALLATLAALLMPAVPAVAADVPPGATWTETTIPSSDGVELHADVLRPKGLPAGARTPVIMSVGPYFNHSGQTGPAGPVEDTGFDPVGPSTGPSDRFTDLIVGGRLMERGYTFVYVDLRGFGGSSGCLDWGGPGEQADVKAAVEWAAAQPWSTGRVGLYGKSYDAVTGLLGIVQQPKGLAAVVAQEPLYDMYRYLFDDGVRFVNSAATPALYDAIAATPGPLLDSPSYNVNGATDPACLARNYAQQQDADHGSAYWKARDIVGKVQAAKPSTPLFLTQGFLENNTKPDGFADLFNAMSGPKRAWFGMWDHVRGNDVDAAGRLKMGRAGFFDETMRFFDHYVRDVPLADAPTQNDPAVATQTSDGSWRSEAAWPPADAQGITTQLRPGTYTDDGQNNGTGSGAGAGVWTISPPLAADAHYAGVPKATVTLAGATPLTNVVIDTYDIAPNRQATLLSRATTLAGSTGKVTQDLYGNDWKLPAGHRVGVLVTGANAEWWAHAPTGLPVTVTAATITLPFLRHTRSATIQGDPALRLEEWKQEAPFEVSQATIDAATTPDFGLPPAQTAPPAGFDTGTPNQSIAGPGSGGGKQPSGKRARRLTVRVARRGKRITVYGTAPTGWRVTARLRRAGKVRRSATRRTKVNAYRMTMKVKRAGRYRVRVTARRGKATLRASGRSVRVRRAARR